MEHKSFCGKKTIRNKTKIKKQNQNGDERQNQNEVQNKNQHKNQNPNQNKLQNKNQNQNKNKNQIYRSKFHKTLFLELSPLLLAKRKVFS